MSATARPAVRYRAYVLADELDVAGLKIAIFDCIFQLFYHNKFNASGRTINMLHSRLDAKDPMLKLLADACCVNDWAGLMGRMPAEELRRMPHNFLATTLAKLYAISEIKEDERILKREDYDDQEAIEEESQAADVTASLENASKL